MKEDMMNKAQIEDNKKWLCKTKTRIGEVEYLVPPKVPNNLKGVYEYVLPMIAVTTLVSDMKAIVANSGLQCTLIDKKAITYGVRLQVFLLGGRGVTESQWNEITDLVFSKLKTCLPEAVPYVEPWDKITKFQARWKGYIKYKEFC